MAQPKLNKITAYQADDGKVFTDKAEYLEYQRKLKCMGGIRAVADRINHVSYACDELGGNCVVNAEQLADFMFENASDIMLALQGKFEVKA